MISLENISSVKELLRLQYTRKVQQNIQTSLQQLYSNYRINIQEGSDKDLEILFQLNKQPFSKEWMDIMQEFATDIFTITINKEVKAVSFSIIDTYTYLPLAIGCDTKREALKPLLFITQLQRAIENQRSMFDLGKIAKEWQTVFPTPKSSENIIPAFQYRMN